MLITIERRASCSIFALSFKRGITGTGSNSVATFTSRLKTFVFFCWHGSASEVTTYRRYRNIWSDYCWYCDSTC